MEKRMRHSAAGCADSRTKAAAAAEKRMMMDRVKQFSREHTLAYCILTEVVFLAALTGIGFLTGSLAEGAGYYVRLLIQEAAGAILAYGILCLSGLQPVLKNRGCGFAKGLLVGLYFIVVSVYSLVMFLVLYEGERNLQPWYLIAVYFGCMACVGIAEEFIFRGVIATLFLKRFGTDRSGIWKAAAVSGVLFGLAHVSNILEGSAAGVLVQVVIASMMGMVLGAVYFRTGCIWVTVFLHALVDVAAGITTGIYGNETLMDTISSYSPVNLISCVPYLIVLFVLLRKKKIGEVEQNMGGLTDLL